MVCSWLWTLWDLSQRVADSYLLPVNVPKVTVAALPIEWTHKVECSDHILQDAGFFPACNDVHIPNPDHLVSLGNYQPFSAISQINPWDLADYDHIAVHPHLQNITKQECKNLKWNAEEALSHLGPFDCTFWTNASFSLTQNASTTACIGYDCSNMTPLKWHHTDTETIISTWPTGFIAVAYTSEMEALELPASIICRDPTHYCGKCIFVGIDCQSCLTAMNLLKRPKYGTVDCSYALKEFYTMACNYNQLIHLQWVPSHIGLQPNEEVDQMANFYHNLLSSNMEHHKSIQPATLKTILKQDATQKFYECIACDTHHTGTHFQVCGVTKSNFHTREPVPQVLQTLYSWWHLGQVESCGTYPRKLKFVEMPACHFCHYPCETTFHLLTTCPGTAAYCAINGLSLDTIQNDSCSNILAIAWFDSFIRDVLPYDSIPPNQQLISAKLTSTTNRKRLTQSLSLTTSEPEQKWHHSDCLQPLIIPLHNNPTQSQKRSYTVLIT